MDNCELLKRCEEDYVPEAGTPFPKNTNASAHREIPRCSPLFHVLSGTFSTTYFIFQICPTALHPGKTEQVTQEQTINCDLFYSIHLIRNRLCLLASLSGELFAFLCFASTRGCLLLSSKSHIYEHTHIYI